MAYSGYLIKVGNYTIPLSIIRAETYSPYKSVTDLDSYVDANGYLHRNALEHIANKVEFETVPQLTNHKDELIGKEKTDKNGTAVFGKDKYNLVYGKYYAVETGCPKGYVLSGDRVEISLKDNPEGTKVLVKEKKVNNKRQRFSLRINKYDSESKNNLKNVRFSLYAMEDIVNRKGEAIVKKGEYLASCLTDENGRAEFEINLPEGKYEIRETETPSGYLLSTKTEIVDLEYNLFKNINEKTEVIEKTMDIDNDFYKGSIVIEKCGEKVTSFNKGNEKEQKAGEFVYEESNLSGAEFALYAAEDIYYPDRRKDEKGELAVLYKKDTLLGKETTDENGKAYFSEDKYLLVYGDYYVTESDAPLGFIKSKDKILFSLKENMQNEKLLTKSEKVENTRQKLAISVKKTDKDSLLPLKGVGFNLYANEDIKNSTGEVIVGNKEYLASGVTDSDGLCVFDIDLPKGSYFVREVSVPEGYFVDNEPVIVETDYDNSGNSKNVKQVFFGTEVTNEMYRGEIKILKVGETLTGIVKGDENESDNSEFVYENKPLSGAIYALYADETIFYPDRRRDEKGNIEILYEKDELIGEETTDDNGMAYFSKDKYLLVRGDYYIKEVSAPKGYILSDDKTVFSFKDNSENKKVILKEAEFKNPRQKFAVKVKKYAEDTNKPLKDAVFSVYADDDLKDADGNVIAHKGEYLGTSISDEDGIADFNLDLCAGRYVIKEIKAPEGYSINTDTFIFEFVKDKSNRDYTETIEVYDKKNPGKTKGKLVKGATETKVTKNNYRTEDIGTNGYSILLKRDDKRKGIILIIIGSLTVSTGILILLSALLKMIRRR